MFICITTFNFINHICQRVIIGIFLLFSKNQIFKLLCIGGEIHQSFLSKELFLKHGFLEIVNNKDEQDPKGLVVDPQLVVEEIATPTKKNLSTKQLPIGKNTPK